MTGNSTPHLNQAIPDRDEAPRLQINRWARHGHDRLYVVGPDGANVGYRDLCAGTDHADTPLHHAVVTSVADSWIRETGWAPANQASLAAVDGAPEPRTWSDLSKNSPGAAIRAALATTGVEDEDSWLAGLAGEKKVGAILAEVTRAWPIWQSLHAVPVGNNNADIDHVVMGPGGVFTLNTKHHQNAAIYVNRNGFLVNGASTHHVRNSRHEAQRAARLISAAVGLPLHVTGLIVPVGARSVTVKEQPEGLFVVPAEELHTWLRGTGTILPVEVLARVWEASRRSSTWRP